jgi:hypothetical protein
MIPFPFSSCIAKRCSRYSPRIQRAKPNANARGRWRAGSSGVLLGEVGRAGDERLGEGSGEGEGGGVGTPAHEQGVGELAAEGHARGGQAGDQAVDQQRAVQRHHPGERAGEGGIDRRPERVVRRVIGPERTCRSGGGEEALGDGEDIAAGHDGAGVGRLLHPGRDQELLLEPELAPVADRRREEEVGEGEQPGERGRRLAAVGFQELVPAASDARPTWASTRSARSWTAATSALRDGK